MAAEDVRSDDAALEDDEEMDEGTVETGGARTFVAGLVIGALVGAGLALLLAPQSGEATRRMLRRQAKRAAHGVQDRYDEIKEKVRRARRRPKEPDEATTG